MPTRTARTAWNGTLQEGSGQVELSSSKVGTFDVSFPKRAADDAGGTTSPEELIAAAHSSCFAMALSSEIGKAGGTPQRLDVTADVDPRPGQGQRRCTITGDRAHRPRRGRRARRRRLRAGRPGGQGRLPGEQGAGRRRHHPGRRPRVSTDDGPPPRAGEAGLVVRQARGAGRLVASAASPRGLVAAAASPLCGPQRDLADEHDGDQRDDRHHRRDQEDPAGRVAVGDPDERRGSPAAPG